MRSLLAILIILLFTLPVSAQISPNIFLDVSDETVAVQTWPYQLRFPVGAVTDNGDVTTSITFPASTITGLTQDEVLTGSSTGGIDSSPNFTYVTGAPDTLTTNASGLIAEQWKWTNGGILMDSDIGLIFETGANDYVIEGNSETIVLNKGGLALDIRIESANKDRMFFLDGSGDGILIGQNGVLVPSATLDIVGTLEVNGTSTFTDTATWTGGGIVLNHTGTPAILEIGDAGSGAELSSDGTTATLDLGTNTSDFSVTTTNQTMMFIDEDRDVMGFGFVPSGVSSYAFNYQADWVTRDMGDGRVRSWGAEYKVAVNATVTSVIGLALTATLREANEEAIIDVLGGAFAINTMKSVGDVALAEAGKFSYNSLITGAGLTTTELNLLKLDYVGNSASTSTTTVTEFNGLKAVADGAITAGGVVLISNTFNWIKLTDPTDDHFSTNTTGIFIDNLTASAGTARAIVLDGDGSGSDIVFGAGQDAGMYWDGSALVVDLTSTYQANGGFNIQTTDSADNFTIEGTDGNVGVNETPVVDAHKFGVTADNDNVTAFKLTNNWTAPDSFTPIAEVVEINFSQASGFGYDIIGQFVNLIDTGMRNDNPGGTASTNIHTGKITVTQGATAGAWNAVNSGYNLQFTKTGSNARTLTVPNFYSFYSGVHSDDAGTDVINGTKWAHFYAEAFPDYNGTIGTTAGLWIEDQTNAGATTVYGIVLAGANAGSDIVFGTSQIDRIFSDDTDLWLDPTTAVNIGDGTGTNYTEIDATGDVNFVGTAEMQEYHLNDTIITSAESPYSVVDTDNVIIVNASGGAVTINLQAVSGQDKRVIYVKCINADNTVTIDASGAETIDDALTQTLSKHESMRLYVSGGEWWII